MRCKYKDQTGYCDIELFLDDNYEFIPHTQPHHIQPYNFNTVIEREHTTVLNPSETATGMQHHKIFCPVWIGVAIPNAAVNLMKAGLKTQHDSGEHDGS